MTVFTEIASGLEFPEGPVALADGSLLVVELLGHRLSRVLPDGAIETVAEIPGGPNGAAVGPAGAVYVCNNGGWLQFVEVNGVRMMGPPDWSAYIGGRIQRVDPDRGTVTDLYTECDGRPLRSPNDLVMDGNGGFWFTDTGIRDPSTRTADITGIYYAHTDGSTIREVVFPTDAPNGIGLSPDGSTLYWTESWRGRILRRTVTGPGNSRRPRHSTRPLCCTHCPASAPSIPSPSTATASCARRPSSTAGSRCCRRTARASNTCPPATSPPPTSVSAARTFAPRTSPSDEAARS